MVAPDVRELALQAMSKGPSPCDLLPAIEQALLLAMREQAQRDCMVVAQQLQPGIEAELALRNAVRAIRVGAGL